MSKGSRYLSQDTGECDASFPLCRLQLNSFKVTETVLQAQASSDNKVVRASVPEAFSEHHLRNQ
jgi:hypothetical protein